MFKLLDLTKDNLIAFRVSGHIEESDYEKINTLLEKQRGNLTVSNSISTLRRYRVMNQWRYGRILKPISNMWQK
ncbi:MAG: hypothetical protein K9J24_14915 [Bacteroidales bacterium]|nr:hypothetical protein [Bacteroidales bacterium]